MGTIARFGELRDVVAGSVDVFTKLDAAAKTLAATVATTAPAMRAEMNATGAAITQVAQGIKDVQQEWQQSQIDMLERLKTLVTKFEGADAGSQFSFDNIINDQIEKIKAGTVTAADAIHELQRQFGAVYGTLQRQFFGSQDPGAQEFLLALERFINSGQLE